MSVEMVNNGEPIPWKQFLELAEEDIRKNEEERLALGKRWYPKWLFRGQSNWEWGLETSLERFLKYELGENSKITVMDYYRNLSKTIPAINSLSGTKFIRFSPNEIKFDIAGTPPQYEFLCYSRHLGFPSPLLDWSVSLYVAAFFAYRHTLRKENPAIYSCRPSDYITWGGEEDPVIFDLGPYVETHPRHYKQQSRYTICATDTVAGDHVFENHEVAAENNPDNQAIKKYVLKHEDKECVLAKLFEMNINDYTLFGDDESLMRMLAYKEFRNL